MTDSEYELRRKQICDFRHSVVAELGNPYLSRGALTKLIKTKAGQKYAIPYSVRTTLTEGCIRRWLSLYRKYGKEGLQPHMRQDCGKSRSISDADQSAIIKLLESNSQLTAIAAVRKLQEQGSIGKDISSSSLSRFITAHGLTASERAKVCEREQTLKFEFFSPLECLQVDVMYGPAVPDEKGKHRRALLVAFLDDATRRVVYARFSFTEKSILFEDGVKHILKAQGMIGRLYTDNGSTFVSNQTKRILDIIGITLTHSRPGRPQGRGKVERFFRTVRDQFTRPLDIQGVKNIDDLNARFHTWLECEYHRSPHRGLADHLTPLDAWIAKAHHIKAVNSDIDLDRMSLHLLSRKVYKDSTFTLNGTLFEAPPVLATKRIDIYFDPHPPITRVQVRHDGKDYGHANIVDSYANTKVKRSYRKPGNLEAQTGAPELPVNLRVTNLSGGK